MGLAGSLRSFQAATNRIERDARRRQRELDRRQALIEKADELEKAAFEVLKFETTVETLKSIHKECSNICNWEDIKASLPPSQPSPEHHNEIKAQNTLDNYKPNFFEKLFKIDNWRRTKLTAEIEKARQLETDKFNIATAEYTKQHEEWQRLQELAVGVLARDGKAYLEAIEIIAPFQEIKDLGTDISFQIVNDSTIVATPHVHAKNIIPAEIKTLLKSGRLSIKEMPTTKFNALYQDYVCGCATRIARELFALLPIKMVIINIIGDLLNTRTGYIEKQPILSAAIPRKTLESLNFDAIDPSDSMENFVHNINFKKKEGFSTIEIINPANLDLNN